MKHCTQILLASVPANAASGERRSFRGHIGQCGAAMGKSDSHCWHRKLALTPGSNFYEYPAALSATHPAMRPADSIQLFRTCPARCRQGGLAWSNYPSVRHGVSLRQLLASRRSRSSAARHSCDELHERLATGSAGRCVCRDHRLGRGRSRLRNAGSKPRRRGNHLRAATAGVRCTAVRRCG